MVGKASVPSSSTNLQEIIGKKLSQAQICEEDVQIEETDDTLPAVQDLQNTVHCISQNLKKKGLRAKKFIP